MALDRLGDPGDGECVMVECFDAEGELRALLSLRALGHGRPLARPDAPRDRDSDNGLVEFMVIELLQTAGQLGVQAGLAELRHVPRGLRARLNRLGAGPFLRLPGVVLLFFSRWWQIESLYRANAEVPAAIWEPRFVLYRARRDLPRIAPG